METKTAGIRGGQVVALLLVTVACGGSSGPVSPSAAPPTSSGEAPTSASDFRISLPIRLADHADRAYGLVPFGAHVGDHGIDGHPGFDFEYAPGSSVLAAASGTVQSVMPSGNGTGYGIQISYAAGGRSFRTIYGVGSLASGVAAGVTIAKGQVLGTVDVYTRTIGRTTVTYAMVHFQLDDFNSNAGLTNVNAVPLDRWLDDESRQSFDTIWRTARYSQELVEPFVANSREAAFPMTRRWTRREGQLAASIAFTRDSGFSEDYSYVLHDGNGAVFESGIARVEPLATPLSTIDLQPSGGGAARGGVYDIVSDTMQIAYGAPGALRPASLATASVYWTR
jgi:hypothetical protein